MPNITVQTENGEHHAGVTAERLAGLVHRIGGEGDHFLVVQRTPALPDVLVQVWHETGGTYTLEHRDGSDERHFQTILDGPEPVVRAMTGWARQETDWDAGLDWEPLTFGPGRLSRWWKRVKRVKRG
ncbi:hypothetical protein [Streptomyces sp. NPDC003023]|uniref:hypothetical protein n=1 Tax=Streptomyces sp. NPDC003023 TaxID=3364675 RepID=UPI0036C00F3B